MKQNRQTTLDTGAQVIISPLHMLDCMVSMPRHPPVLNRNLEDGPASIYTIRTRSRRVNTGQALV